MPRGHSYLWTPWLLVTEVVTNGVIAGACLVMALSGLRRAAAHPNAHGALRALALAAFGLTVVHLLDAWVIWTPAYGVDAVARGLTALVAVTAALLVIRVPGRRAVQTGEVPAPALVTPAGDLAYLGLLSHELRAPMMSQLLQIEKLRRALGVEGGASAHQDALDKLADATERMSDAVYAMLDYAAIKSGRAPTVRARIPLAALFDDVIDELGPRAADKQLTLRRGEVADEALDSDPRLVRLALINLTANALKFTTAGFVELSATRDPRGVGLCVRDSGPGIPADARDRIFEPFERLTPNSAGRGGMGLGLALVKEIAVRLGAEILLASEPGRGSTFTLLFPAAADGGPR
jgi:signal transduction histidine kinase